MDEYERRKEITKALQQTGTESPFDIQNTIEASIFEDLSFFSHIKPWLHGPYEPLELPDEFQCHFFGGEYRLGEILQKFVKKCTKV